MCVWGRARLQINISDVCGIRDCEDVMKRWCVKQKQPNGWEVGTTPPLLIWCNSKVEIISWTSYLPFGLGHLIPEVVLPVPCLAIRYSCLSILTQGLGIVFSGKAYCPLLSFLFPYYMLRM